MRFQELQCVRVTRPVLTPDGHQFPAGTRGVVVHVYRGGAAYAVELFDPAFVFDATPDDLAPIID